MAESFVDQIINRIEQTIGMYYRLVIVAAPAGSGKTLSLQKVQQRIDAPIVNVNLEISRQMLALTEKQRILQLPRLLDDIIVGAANDLSTAKERPSAIILDNLEILFDVTLKQDPFRLLQQISRNRTIAAAWNGRLKDRYLIYAEPGHPEYRRDSAQDLLVVNHELPALVA